MSTWWCELELRTFKFSGTGEKIGIEFPSWEGLGVG